MGAESDAFVCGTAEIVCDEGAHVVYAVVQSVADDARVLFQRAALPGRDARVLMADAELGGWLAAADLSVSIEEPGSDTEIVTLFFPAGSQHVDVVSTVDHRAGDATSQTLVKSAGTDRGQARFLGNIRIAEGAQGSDARLRDDALLLSAKAHVDSVPALEIAANDVKAYHGATVGAIDDEQIFYMESRGIERASAERMIALGFFEPAIDRFPTECMRDAIRGALAAQIIRESRRSGRSIGLPESARDFPILSRPTSRGKRLVYLDSAATSQKPAAVIDALSSTIRIQRQHPSRRLRDRAARHRCIRSGTRQSCALHRCADL